jgi:hypothetical protein
VIGLLQNGETVESIVTRCFPIITRAQVCDCLAYYVDHRGEIDVLVARQMAAPTSYSRAPWSEPLWLGLRGNLNFA